jgi:hypothetical protein
MRKFFLFMLAILLPLQPLVAAEADFAHLVQGQQSREETMHHMMEHLNHAVHQHGQDKGATQSQPGKSSGHLLLCDCMCSLTMLPVTGKMFTAEHFADPAPVFVSDLYQSHSPPPLTKPPLKTL